MMRTWVYVAGQVLVNIAHTFWSVDWKISNVASADPSASHPSQCSVELLRALLTSYATHSTVCSTNTVDIKAGSSSGSELISGEMSGKPRQVLT